MVNIKREIPPRNVDSSERAKKSSFTRPPLLDGQFYSWLKIRMRDYLMTKDINVWYMIWEGPYVPTMEVKVGEITRVIPKTRK